MGRRMVSGALALSSAGILSRRVEAIPPVMRGAAGGRIEEKVLERIDGDVLSDAAEEACHAHGSALRSLRRAPKPSCSAASRAACYSLDPDGRGRCPRTRLIVSNSSAQHCRVASRNSVTGCLIENVTGREARGLRRDVWRNAADLVNKPRDSLCAPRPHSLPSAGCIMPACASRVTFVVRQRPPVGNIHLEAMRHSTSDRDRDQPGALSDCAQRSDDLLHLGSMNRVG